MLDVGVIGLGNTGNQIATLAKEKLNIPVIAINSSDKDLETVPKDIPRKLITNKEGTSQGAGKNRSDARKYLKDSIKSIVSDKDIEEIILSCSVIFVVSSTGGGTGSGTAPVFAKILHQRYPDVKIIMIGVLPVMDEGLSSHVNTLQYLDELYKKLDKQTYMLYDNDKLSNLPSYQLLQKINEEIVKDIDVLRCTYNYTTKLDSIDDRDMTRIISFPGRIIVNRLEDFKEKDIDSESIEEQIVDNIKNNSVHVEGQRDKKVMATGIISNLSIQLTEVFNNNVPLVREFVGDPVHVFTHISVNEDRKMPNNVFFIMSGLTPISDKIAKISERIDEINEHQKIMEDALALDDIDMDELSNKIKDEKEEISEDPVQLNDIFDEFDD